MSNQPMPHNNTMPSGLLGDVAEFIAAAAPYPNTDIALAGSIAFLSGITGKAYNTYTGAGLNQYMLLLASTGMGKEAIAGGISKLIMAIAASVPAATDFKGPGQIASAPGLIKWLDKKPAFVCILGEFGLKLKGMASPKASPNDIALKAILLDIYGKSGAGNVLDPMAYSDVAKNTATIISPSLTIIGESVPGVFYETLDEGMIASGLLPRFMVSEATGERPYCNHYPAIEPPTVLVQQLANLCAHCLQLAHRNVVQVVPADADASETFRQFEAWTTDQINGASSEVTRQLWNRAHLKALKLASVDAIGFNYLQPSICQQGAQWATNLVASQTNHLLSKFERGEVGEVSGDEGKQLREVMRVVKFYATNGWRECSKYHGDEAMHRAGVITLAHISQRLCATAAFRKDRLGATKAIERAIKSLLESDQLREVPGKQMVDMFGKHPRAFCVSDPGAILAA